MRKRSVGRGSTSESMAAVVMSASLGLVLLAGCASEGEPPDTGTTSSSSSAADTVQYVALGDSWPYGGHCGGCETFVDRYVSDLEEALGVPVEFIDETRNGGDTAAMLDLVSTDESVRSALADADIIVVSTGLNDLDTSGALEAIADGSCGPEDACLNDVFSTWRENFAGILDEIEQLRSGGPTVLRLVTAQNIFVSDPSIGADYGLPAEFATNAGRRLTTELTNVMCEAAAAHDGMCVDVAALFNGPTGTAARDENTPESHQEVADALAATGTAELER